jgi:hypothetical protein
MKRKNIRGMFSKPMDSEAPPVVEDKNLPTMPKIEVKRQGDIKNPPKGKGLMPSPTTEKVKVSQAAIAKGTHMAPFDPREVKKIKLKMPEEGLMEQVEKKGRKKTDAGYVVLRMRVQNGELAVIGSRLVEGPFLESQDLIPSGIAYEVSLKRKRIAIGSLPDVGEQRSFPRPKEGHEHHITVLPGFDFNLKIPANKIKFNELPGVDITLYRFKENIPMLPLTEAPLAEQFERQVRTVAHMKGIQVKRLTEDIQKSLKKAFAR